VAFFLIVPLGFLSPKVGLVLWLVCLITSLLGSIWLIWVLHGRPESGLHYCGYLFAPAIACLMAGQIGIFLLLGIVLFLYFHSSWPFLAGVALLPCVWKPHLFCPFFIVLFLWSVNRKEFRIIAGFLTILLVSCALTLFIDRNVWSQYFRMMSEAGVLQAYVPTLSVTIRFLIDPKAVWLQFIPEVAACVWAVWYFWTRRTQWSWIHHGMLVLLVSALCTPYAWLTDEAVLLPAVLAGAYRAPTSGRSLWPIACLGTVALLEVIAIGRMTSPFYLWTVPAWLGWYLYANWRKTFARNAEVMVT
jgi:hypothetical protein